jgi:hypothetical protein
MSLVIQVDHEPIKFIIRLIFLDYLSRMAISSRTVQDGVRHAYKKRKVHCRNSRPLTIACHMKKKVKSCWGEAFRFVVAFFSFFLSLPCYRCWWCKSKVRQHVYIISFFTISLCQTLLNICKTLVQQAFQPILCMVANDKNKWITAPKSVNPLLFFNIYPPETRL